MKMQVIVTIEAPDEDEVEEIYENLVDTCIDIANSSSGHIQISNLRPVSHEKTEPDSG